MEIGLLLSTHHRAFVPGDELDRLILREEYATLPAVAAQLGPSGGGPDLRGRTRAGRAEAREPRRYVERIPMSLGLTVAFVVLAVSAVVALIGYLLDRTVSGEARETVEKRHSTGSTNTSISPPHGRPTSHAISSVIP